MAKLDTRKVILCICYSVPFYKSPLSGTIIIKLYNRQLNHLTNEIEKNDLQGKIVT